NGSPLWSYQTPDQVNAVAVSRDGSAVLAGAKDGVAYLLDGEGKLLQTFAHADEVLAVALSADGGVLAVGTAGGEGTVLDRAAAGEALAASQTRRRWLTGGSLVILLGLVASGAWAVRYTTTGYQ